VTDDADQPQAAGPEPERSDALDRTFNIALILNGLDGLLELLGGVLLIVLSPVTLNRLAENLTQHELSQDPHDFIVHRLLRLTANLHDTQTFGAVYLLTHGLVKLVIVVGLFRREHWAYYFAFVFLGGFVVYQVYRLTYAPSVGLALLTVFDIFIIWLTWREYGRMRTDRVRHQGCRSLIVTLNCKPGRGDETATRARSPVGGEQVSSGQVQQPQRGVPAQGSPRSKPKLARQRPRWWRRSRHLAAVTAFVRPYAVETGAAGRRQLRR